MRTENCNAFKLVFESHKIIVNPDSFVFTYAKIKQCDNHFLNKTICTINHFYRLKEFAIKSLI